MSFNLTYEELLQRRLSVYEHVVHITPGQIIPELSINVVISEGLPIRKITVPEIRNDIQKRAEDEKGNSNGGKALIRAWSFSQDASSRVLMSAPSNE